MRISLVPEEAVGRVWKDVEGILSKAVDTVENKSDVIDILNGVFSGTYILWVVLDDDDKIVAAFTTRLIVYPCLLYTSPSPRDGLLSRMPSSA